MTNDGYTVEGIISTPKSNVNGDLFDLEFDENGNFAMFNPAEAYKKVQWDIKNRLFDTKGKTLTKEILEEAINKVTSFGDIKVTSVDWMPKSQIATVNVSYMHPATYSAIVTNFSFPEDPINWDSFANSKEAKDIRNQIGKIDFTKARMLMFRALPKDFKQIRGSWIKTVYIFTYYSSEELVEFLIDPSETVREAAKLRIKQIEDN